MKPDFDKITCLEVAIVYVSHQLTSRKQPNFSPVKISTHSTLSTTSRICRIKSMTLHTISSHPKQIVAHCNSLERVVFHDRFQYCYNTLWFGACQFNNFWVHWKTVYCNQIWCVLQFKWSTATLCQRKDGKGVVITLLLEEWILTVSILLYIGIHLAGNTWSPNWWFHCETTSRPWWPWCIFLIV